MHLRTLGLAAAGFALCSPLQEQHPHIWCCLSFLPVPILRGVARLSQHPELQQEEEAARKKSMLSIFFFLVGLMLHFLPAVVLAVV